MTKHSSEEPAGGLLTETADPPVAEDTEVIGDVAETEPAGRGRPSSRRLGSVFWTAAGVSMIFIAWATLFTDNLNTVTDASLNWVTGTFGWLYLVTTLAILVFLVFLALSLIHI